MPIHEISESGVIPGPGARHQLGIGHTTSRHGEDEDGWAFQDRTRAWSLGAWDWRFFSRSQLASSPFFAYERFVMRHIEAEANTPN
jgi:hypothetical protein